MLLVIMLFTNDITFWDHPLSPRVTLSRYSLWGGGGKGPKFKEGPILKSKLWLWSNDPNRQDNVKWAIFILGANKNLWQIVFLFGENSISLGANIFGANFNSFVANSNSTSPDPPPPRGST